MRKVRRKLGCEGLARHGCLWDPRLESSKGAQGEILLGFTPKTQAGFMGKHNGRCPQILGCTRGAMRGHTSHGAVVKPRWCHPLPVPPHSHQNPTKLVSFQPLENKIFPSLIRDADSHYYVK